MLNEPANHIPFHFFFSSRRRHTRFSRDWSSDVCSSDLGDDLDVTDVVAAELHVHQAGDPMRGIRFLVVLEPLHEGRGAVTESDDGDANRAHAVRSFLRSVADARRFCPTGAVMPYLVRSCWINPASHAMSASVAARPCSMSARW